MSNADTKADVARGDHEDAPPPSSGRQTDHFIKSERAKRHTALLHEAGCILLGLVSLAAVTGVYFWLDVPLVAAAFTYLAVIVLLSLVNNFSSLIVLSFVGVGCLSYFFAPPIYSFRVDYPQDLISISAFVITSFVVNFLVTRVRFEQGDHMKTSETLRDANQRLGGANAALQESEYKLRQIIETVPGLLWSTAADGEPTHLNRRMLDYSGMRIEDFKHRGWKAFVHPADFPETAEALYHAIQTGTSFQHVMRLRRADGEFRWHEARTEPLRDRQGCIIQRYGVCVDIDEGKKAEDRLRRSEAYLAEAQRLSHTGSFGWTPSTGELHWSDETFRILEYDPRIKPTVELVLERIHPDDRAMIQQLIAETSSGEKDFDVMHRLLMPDGSVKFVHVLSHALKDAAGNLEIVGALMDVTENTLLYRDLAEREARLVEQTAALRRSEAHLAEAQRLSHIGSATYNDTTILHWSDETYRIFEFDPLEGPPSIEAVLQRIHPDDRERMQEVQRGVRQKKDYEREYKLVLPATIKYIEGIVHPKFSASGEFVEVISTIMDVTDRKRAEERLRRSEAYLAEAQRLSHSGVSAFNETQILYGSEETYRIWGFDPAQGVPSLEAIFQRIHPDDRDRLNAEVQRAVKEKSRYSTGYKIVLPDGTLKYLEVTGQPVFSASGELVEIVTTQIDVTERKRAEDRLRRSEAYLAETQRLSHTGSAVYNETTPLYWSEETYRLWGFDPSQGIPSLEAVIQRVHPDDRDRADAEIRGAVRENKRYSIEYRILLPDGTVKHLESIGQPVFSAGGELVEIITTQIDVTERKHAEQALRDSEEALRRNEAWLIQAQRLSRTGSWVYNAATKQYRYWSDESYWIWGFDRLQGLPSRENMWQRIHPDDRDGVREAVEEALRQKRDFTHELRIVLPDGTVKYLEATTHHLFSPLGELLEAISTHVDVTERKRAQEEHERLRHLELDLAHMNRLSMMGEQAASLAHEIAQPIATARNNARAAMHFLDRSQPDPGQVREAIACVVDDADRAGDILDRIRDHIKKAPPRKEPVDLNQAIIDVIALAHGAIVENDISIQTHLAKGLSDVQADRVQLQQVVLNLILNAVEAMGSVENGVRQLSISTEQYQAGGVLVAVRDSGPGLDPSHLERVFDAFYTTKSSGTGMGLSICRSIIDAHGGRLWAEANEPRGAVFQFMLPAVQSLTGA